MLIDISNGFYANMPASITATFFGTSTIVISLVGVNTDANLVRFGFGTKSAFPSVGGNSDFLLFRVSGTVFIIIIIIIIIFIIIIID